MTDIHSCSSFCERPECVARRELPVVAWMECVAMGEPTTGYRNAAFALEFGKHDLVRLSDATALIDKLTAERDALIDDRDSWQQQADARTADALRFAAERDELRAARFAYASEFPLNADGEPDVGNVHANIRALKAKVQQYAAQLLIAESQALERPSVERVMQLADAYADAAQRGDTATVIARACAALRAALLAEVEGRNHD